MIKGIVFDLSRLLVNSKKRIIYLVLSLVMVVAFLLGSSSAISVNGKEYDQPTWLRVADMLVISALVLMVIATTAVAIATIRSHFKRK